MRLGVNIDHVATIRQARRGRCPDPVEAALVCERAGASSVVCHLREDRRHIQDEDVQRLKAAIRTRLNLEMSIAKDIVEVALAIRPAQVTLVPERRQELTTEGGLDVLKLSRKLVQTIEAFHTCGIRVSVFIDPVERQVIAAHNAGVPMVELHTGRYANACSPRARARELAALQRAAQIGRGLGLSIAAGHGLDYDNVHGLAKISEVEELNIGFSIIARAVFVGLERAVREMVERLARTPTHALQAAPANA